MFKDKETIQSLTVFYDNNHEFTKFKYQTNFFFNTCHKDKYANIHECTFVYDCQKM